MAKKNKSIQTISEGEEFILPRARTEQWICCGCGFTHNIRTRIGVDKQGRLLVLVRLWRNDKMTKTERRRHGIKVLRRRVLEP